MSKLIYTAREIHDRYVSTTNISGSGIVPDFPSYQFVPKHLYEDMKKSKFWWRRIAFFIAGIPIGIGIYSVFFSG